MEEIVLLKVFIESVTFGKSLCFTCEISANTDKTEFNQKNSKIEFVIAKLLLQSKNV